MEQVTSINLCLTSMVLVVEGYLRTDPARGLELITYLLKWVQNTGGPGIWEEADYMVAKALMLLAIKGGNEIDQKMRIYEAEMLLLGAMKTEITCEVTYLKCLIQLGWKRIFLELSSIFFCSDNI